MSIVELFQILGNTINNKNYEYLFTSKTFSISMTVFMIKISIKQYGICAILRK